jgi:hypothetical protein
MAELKNVEVFAEGTWVGSAGPMKWNRQDIQDMIKTTELLISKKLIKPPKLKLGHSSTQIANKKDGAAILQGQSDGDPKLGNVSNYVIGDGENNKAKLLVDFINMPDIVYEAMVNDLYTDVSAEVVYYNGYGWYLSAVALLGADIPAVKTLEDLQAFIPHSEGSAYSSNTFTLRFSEPIFIGGLMGDDNNNKSSNNGGSPGAQETVTTLLNDNQKLRTDYSAKETEVEKLKKERDDKDKVILEYQKKELKTKFATQKAEILKPYEEDSKKLKLAPALVQEITACLDGQEADFTEKSQLYIKPELARKISQAYMEKSPNQGGDNDKGGAYKGDDELEKDQNPSDVVAKEIKIIQAAAGRAMSYSEATDALIAKKPEVWQAYCEWSSSVSNLGLPVLMKQQ